MDVQPRAMNPFQLVSLTNFLGELQNLDRRVYQEVSLKLWLLLQHHGASKHILVEWKIIGLPGSHCNSNQVSSSLISSWKLGSYMLDM